MGITYYILLKDNVIIFVQYNKRVRCRTIHQQVVKNKASLRARNKTRQTHK